jgi:hypothetical protein
VKPAAATKASEPAEVTADVDEWRERDTDELNALRGDGAGPVLRERPTTIVFSAAQANADPHPTAK